MVRIFFKTSANHCAAAAALAKQKLFLAVCKTNVCGWWKYWIYGVVGVFFFYQHFPLHTWYIIFTLLLLPESFSGLIWGPEWMEVKQVSLTEVCSSNLFVMLFFPLVDYKHHNNKKKINSYSIVNKLKWDTHLNWFCCTYKDCKSRMTARGGYVWQIKDYCFCT